MKLWAIARRGSKKDFFDLYFLLREFDIMELMAHFVAKMPNVQPFLISRSITYFNDAEEEVDPEMLEDVSWEEVKQGISDHNRKYLAS